MRKDAFCLGLLVGLFVAAGCSSPKEGESARDFEVYLEDGALDKVTLEDDFGNSFDSSIDRDRVGGRFAFGGESTRGYFQVFKEDWEFTLDSGDPGAQYDNLGLGGGVKGAVNVGEAGDGIALLVPYRLDMSIVFGEKSNTIPGESATDLVYLDSHLDAGFGIDWKGLRPSVGLALNLLAGSFSTPVGDATLSAANFGFFVDVLYKHAEFPLYGHLRFLTGDYEATTIGIGAKF